MSTPQYFPQGQPVQQPVQLQQPPTGAPSQVVQAPPTTGGGVYYAPGATPVVYISPGQFNQPNYTYKPNDFFVLSAVMTGLCGIVSPLFLVLTVPAILFSQKSREHAKAGLINKARKSGMISAYLNLAAVVGAFVVACLVAGLVLGLYGPVYSRNLYYRRNGYYY